MKKNEDMDAFIKRIKNNYKQMTHEVVVEFCGVKKARAEENEYVQLF